MVKVAVVFTCTDAVRLSQQIIVNISWSKTTIREDPILAAYIHNGPLFGDNSAKPLQRISAVITR